MAELDRWSEELIIGPLWNAWERSSLERRPEVETRADVDAAEAAVKKAIRDKVLESYRNGQAAGVPRNLPRRSERR